VVVVENMTETELAPKSAETQRQPIGKRHLECRASHHISHGRSHEIDAACAH
jgi:hypothetical protein